MHFSLFKIDLRHFEVAMPTWKKEKFGRCLDGAFYIDEQVQKHEEGCLWKSV